MSTTRLKNCRVLRVLGVKYNNVKFFAFFFTFYNVPDICNIRHDGRDRVRVRVQLGFPITIPGQGTNAPGILSQVRVRVRVQSRFRWARHECTRYFVTTSTSTRVQSRFRRARHKCTRYFVTTSTSTRFQSRRQARHGTRYFVTSNVIRRLQLQVFFCMNQPDI